MCETRFLIYCPPFFKVTDSLLDNENPKIPKSQNRQNSYGTVFTVGKLYDKCRNGGFLSVDECEDNDMPSM